MDILISFCNTSGVTDFPNLGILNSANQVFSILDLPKEIPLTGMVGMAVSSQFIFIGLQHESAGKETFESPPLLLIFDKKTFNLLHHYRFLLARDLHSLLLLPGENALLVASTGTDEIIRLELDGFHVLSEHVIYQIGNGAREDHHHLNSLVSWQGDIYVSGFGTKEEGGDWSTARNGFILNLENEEKIVEGLEHPHSLSVINGRLAFCESRKKTLRFVGDTTSVNLSGYTRGLCVAGEDIFIATSTQRKKSKSTGKPITSDELQNAGCTLSRIRIGNSRIEETIDLNPFGYEVYDLLPIEKTDSWPVVKAVPYRFLYEQSWLPRVENVLADIQKIVPKNETILLVDQDWLGVSKNILPEHRCLPFLEKNGLPWGSPSNEEVAMIELKRMCEEKDAGFMAIAWPSFWWFDVYPDFIHYLRHNFDCVLENEDVVVFSLLRNISIPLVSAESSDLIMHE